MEQQIQRGQQWLKQLLILMGTRADVKVGKVVSDPTESEACWLIIDESALIPEQIELLIGEKGETLDAIQYLANTLLNIGLDSPTQKAFTVELDGYRVRRQAELLTLAEKVAQAVRETGQEMEMKDLSSAERRQVHNFLKEAEDLETESRGQEPHRRLVVRLR
jgi:spoIIIJ-associated protein